MRAKITATPRPSTIVGRFPKRSFAMRFVLILVVIAVCNTGPATAAETVLDRLKDAVERDDFRAVKKLIEVLPDDVIGAFFSAAEAHLESLRTGDSDRARIMGEVLIKIGNAYYVTKNNSEFERYAQFIRNLRAVKGASWIEGWKAYRTFKEASRVAWEDPDIDVFSKAIDLGLEVGPHFERINDYYLLGWICQDLGRLYGQKSSTEEAQEQYEQAKTYFAAFGADQKVQETQSFLDRLSQGNQQTAIAARKEAADTAADQAKLEAEKPLWRPVKLLYRPAEKMDFATPNPLSTQLWVNWSGNRILEGKFGAFYDATVFEAAAFMAYYSDASVVGIRPRSYSPVARYQLVHENKKMYLDTNDDGEVQKPERVNIGGRPSFIEFNLETEDGEPFKYAVNMCELKEEKFFAFKARYDPGNVKWQRACWMQGDGFDGKRVVLIDDNNNGTYTDWGADAIVVGSGSKARFLSEILDVDGALYRVKIEDTLGREVHYMPHEGPTGMVKASYKGKRTPSSMYIMGANKNTKTTIMLLDLKKPVKVPVGQYVFYFGMIEDGKGKGRKTIEIRRGMAKPFDVNEGETVELAFGAPFTFEYRIRTDGDQGELRGSDLDVHGVAGELYTRFYPEVPKGSVLIKASRGGVVAKEKLKPIDTVIFNEGPHLAWFPRDVLWDLVGKDVEYSAKIRAKHSLLGTISCDFK